ncbi:MAG: FixH family protein [Lysinibacillus sp.]|nr:FixH family protein [Lysinibacillus sp.]
MKKLTITFTTLLLFVLAGCSASNDVEVEIKELYYKGESPSAFEIFVTEKGEPLEGLTISAELAMLNMDHGKVEVVLEEEGNGVYSSEINLPMAGSWETVFAIERDGELIEKVMEYDVEESSIVAIINGEPVTTEDIEFYRFINELHIAIGRENDKNSLQGQELQNALQYWEQEEEMLDRNSLLTQIIRLRAMALLGEEKGHTATSEEVAKEIENIREQYNEFEIAQSMIEKYGEERFWEKEEEQYKLIILSQKVQEDLIEDVRGKNKNVTEQEIMYLASKAYDDLLVSQVNSLEIKFF